MRISTKRTCYVVALRTEICVDYHDEQSESVILNCGHKHRTIDAAERCMRQYDGTTASLSASVWQMDGNGDERAL